MGKGENIKLNIDGEEIFIGKEDVEIVSSQITGWIVESDEGVTVALDTELNDQLIAEGLVREFVNRIQNMRKDAGFEVTDKIKIKFNGSGKIISAVNSSKEYISNETLAENIVSVESFNGSVKQDWNIGEYKCSIQIEKANS